jgi:hypothetical protein
MGVGELHPIRAEELDPVILEGVMGGGDHDAEVGAQTAGEHGDGGRRQRPGEDHVHARAQEAGGQRLFEHITGEAGILADEHLMAVAAAGEHEAGGLSEAERGLGRHGVDIGAATDAVGAEE